MDALGLIHYLSHFSSGNITMGQLMGTSLSVKNSNTYTTVVSHSLASASWIFIMYTKVVNNQNYIYAIPKVTGESSTSSRSEIAEIYATSMNLNFFQGVLSSSSDSSMYVNTRIAINNRNLVLQVLVKGYPSGYTIGTSDANILFAYI